MRGNRPIGKVWSNEDGWVSEIQPLGLFTQGCSYDDAIESMRDVIRLLVDDPWFDFEFVNLRDGAFEILVSPYCGHVWDAFVEKRRKTC